MPFGKLPMKLKEDGGLGSTLIKGKAVNVMTTTDYDANTSNSNNNKVTGVQLDNGTVIEADAFLLSYGPWTANLMRGVKYHAVVMLTKRTLHQCAFFSGAGDPEVYVRPDQLAYLRCGFPDETIRVTEEPGKEEVRPEAVERIVKVVRLATSSSSPSAAGRLSATPAITSACYLPTTPDNIPIMGPLSSKEADRVGGCFIAHCCFIATGYGCWGILVGPGTGESMVTLIASGKGTEHVILQPFDPARFQTIRVLER